MSRKTNHILPPNTCSTYLPGVTLPEHVLNDHPEVIFGLGLSPFRLLEEQHWNEHLLVETTEDGQEARPGTSPKPLTAIFRSAFAPIPLFTPNLLQPPLSSEGVEKSISKTLGGLFTTPLRLIATQAAASATTTVSTTLN